VLTLLRSLARNQRLLKEFVVRDLKARYIGSSMGFFWSVVFPIINLFVFMFVFRLVLNARWGDKQGATEVALVMLAGIVVWAGFAETISRSTNTLVENQNLIQKVVFPSEVLPVYLTISSIINMCIGLPVVLLCVVWFAFLAPPSVGFGDAAQRVGETGGSTVVRVETERGHRSDVVVPFTLGGTAELGVDYRTGPTPLPNAVVIPSGSTFTELRIDPIADGVPEEEETIVVTLEPGPRVDGERATHTITLADGAAPGRPSALPPDGAPPVEDDYSPLNLGWPLVALPLLFFLQVIFTTGLGYFLATLNVFLRDTYHLVGVLVTVWMFSTPIFYPAAMVPESFHFLLVLNPMHWLIESYRRVLLYAQWPDVALMARFAVVGLAVLYLGSRFFLSQKRRFPDLL